MPQHFFDCPDCGTRREVNVPIAIGAKAAQVYCPACDADLQRTVRMVAVPGIGRMSIFSDGDSRNGPKDFSKFTTQIEDPASPSGYREVTIGSLADIRRLERESEQAERNGEGRKMVWRDYAQDHSNADQHSFMADPSEKPSKTYTNGTPVKVRKGDPVTADHGTLEGAEA